MGLFGVYGAVPVMLMSGPIAYGRSVRYQIGTVVVVCLVVCALYLLRGTARDSANLFPPSFCLVVWMLFVLLYLVRASKLSARGHGI